MARSPHHFQKPPAIVRQQRADKNFASEPKKISQRDATILLVDDDLAVLESLGRALATEGWRIIGAASGEEALERLAHSEPDLIITDLSMNGINGWDLLFHEKMQRPRLPIFVITAHPPSSVQGADHIASAFFQKPLDVGVLVAAIHRCLCSPESTKP